MGSPIFDNYGNSIAIAKSYSLNVKDMLDIFKLYDMHDMRSITLSITITKSSAVGDGRIAIRGCSDIYQMGPSADIAFLDLGSTSGGMLSEIAVTPGSTQQKFVVQVKNVEFTSVEVYVKTPDTGTSVVANIESVSTGSRSLGILKAAEQATLLRNKIGNIATRVPCVVPSTVQNSTPRTYRFIIEVAGKFKRVRPIFINTSTTQSYTVSACRAYAVQDLTTPPSFASGIAVPIPNSGSVPAAVGDAYTGATYIYGDWVDLDAVQRTDGGLGYLVCFDAYCPTAAALSACGSTTANTYSRWATRARQQYVMRWQNADFTNNPAGFTSITNQERSIFAGVQYEVADDEYAPVLTIVSVGDSISHGSVSTVTGENFTSLAMDALSASNSFPFKFEHVNIAVAAKLASEYSSVFASMAASGVPMHIAVLPSGTPNGNGGSLNGSKIETQKTYFLNMLDTCKTYRIMPIFWTMLPYIFGATDSFRTNYNNRNKKYFGAIAYCDFAELLKSSNVDGNGGYNLNTTYSNDTIHPNDAGQVVLGYALSKVIREIRLFRG